MNGFGFMHEYICTLFGFLHKPNAFCIDIPTKETGISYKVYEYPYTPINEKKIFVIY